MAIHQWRRTLPSRFHLTRLLSSSTTTTTSSSSSSHRRRVFVTGLGMVTPLGCGVGTTWKRLIEGDCGIRALTIKDLRLDNFDVETQNHVFDQLSSKVAAVVPSGTDSGQFNDLFWFKEHRSISRFIGYALCAADEALKDANWIPTKQDEKERTGVSIGGGIGSMSDIVDAAQLICEKRLRRLSPFFVPRILINMASGHVSMKYGFQGPNHAAVTACATGAHSIGDAARMILFGDADVMVAGGTEASIDALSIAGFCRLKALSTKYNSSPCEASRPFDVERDGFVIGEGCGVVVLEELEHAKERGAKIYAELCGYGMSGDAYHITQPHNDGRGAILAMTSALKQSGLHSNQVDYVNAHATSTPLGDAIEAAALKVTFGEHAKSGALAFSSTKGAIGHLLGAAGAVEAIFSVLAIHHGVAPLTLNLSQPDLVFSDAFMPLTASKQMNITAAMSNSFGFGGTNTSLLFTKVS
ncbi:3-oxoacyl-[acyl-carrier-protein] synthase, mitochondrial-like [Chenopodium quinoa]|uniref:3-oxoacyl-[acyl-carrier-protein] synthase, mitochondrial n=1 Tax=Chenopodium quinoa TaxID=63459 RepID=A0A803LRI7_CHEQI|nr:3-oxoacyl-[acyl-carrier-protein] synthase, mitochondrial-like [Chenopodium quinoa]